MRLFVVVTLLSRALTLALKPENCTLMINEEDVYECQLPNDTTITLASKKNEYVNVRCENSNINCDDIPIFDFASELPLQNIGFKFCPPSLLRCINKVVNTTYAKQITLERVTKPLSGEDVGNLGAVNTLLLRNAKVQNIVPIAAIRNLPTLREVRLGGGNMTLIPHAFEGAPPLTYLEFNDDHLTSIPPDSFSGLSNLTHLNIWRNDIENITVGAFSGLDVLRKLKLTRNNLKSIEPGTFDILLKLGDLFIADNKIDLLPNGLLSNLKELVNSEELLTLPIKRAKTLLPVQMFTLKGNLVELRFGSYALSNLLSLKKIDLEKSKINILPESLFNGSTSVEILKFSNNNIEDLPTKIFTSMGSLKCLDLSDNKVKSLHKNIFHPLKHLSYLNMNHNHLISLPAELFDGLEKLKEIYFDHNSLVSIASTTLGGLANIQILSLAFNKLSLDTDEISVNKLENRSDKNNLLTTELLTTNSSIINNDYLVGNEKTYTSPFKSLKTLKHLNLIGNEISYMFEDWRLDLNQLEYLDLSYNKFTEIRLDEGPEAKYFISSHLTVDLRHNEINRIYLSSGVSMTKVNANIRDESNYTTTILLNYNPFTCDCHMYSVKSRLHGDVLLSNEAKLDLNNARCSLPLHLKGNRIPDVSSTDLVCNLFDNNSNNCITIARPASNELILNCPIFPTQLPVVKDLWQKYFNKEPTITVKSKQPPASLDGLKVHKLVLSDIGLKSIDFLPSKYLKVLDLSNNNINKIPLAFLNANVSLYLVNNSLECTCDNSKDLAILKSYKYVYNATCDKVRLIKEIDLEGLCNLRNALVISLGSFLLIAICIILTGIIICKYWNEIIIFMIDRGICNSCVKKNVSDKTYDVFISFAHEDYTFVDNILLPRLENSLNQRVCDRYQHWPIGGLIPEQIQYSVKNSRKTIVILSKSFLEYSWANLEFFTAHNLTLQEHSSRIILILLEDSLAGHPKLSPELKAYISTNTYLLKDDTNFWKKLDKALETKSYQISWLGALKRKKKSEGPSKNDKSNKDKKTMADDLNVQFHNGQLVNVVAQHLEDRHGVRN